MDHDTATELLPWLANGTLAGAERAALERHLGGCASCRAELELCRHLEQGVRAREAEAWQPPDGQLDRILQRLGPQPAAPVRGQSGWGARPRRWTLAAPAALAAGLACLLLWTRSDPEPSLYTTLSDPEASLPAAGPQLQLAFAERTPEAEMRALLNGVRGSIVSGPSPLGIYTVALPEGEPLDAIVEALREDPRVRLVEPLGQP